MKILKIPELRQAYVYDCGANAVQSVLEYYGIDIKEGPTS
jgi:predicted double-glycine peptidase